jgi:hypothetical protein
VRKAILAAVAVAALGVACFPQGTCESAYVEYCYDGDPNCQGQILDATHWISGPIDGAWIPFGPEQTFTMHLRDAVTGQVLTAKPGGMVVNGFVGATQVQDPNGVLPAICGGNLCEALQLDASSFRLRNDTCASEFFWASVEIVPETTDAGAADSGADSSTDAGTE